ncbi:DEAD box helicase [Ectocarpus siliculosus]|uniref:DEAD box helicase n=1 Tax=Ectocarpus siliculosus TaxID=2880 RepID=D7FQZ7_ECTSI|nr:DEAD box helicase [Ectocarpus siliculosus]|eukprot:CBJ26151.1 DEAD box helicase [Ectocarpus siliculosus]
MAAGGGGAAAANPRATTAAEAPAKTLRGYQSRIANKCLHDNTIVVLPTGSGKTLLAAEVIKRLGPPALFLVPTCLLVDQQAEALGSWTGLSVAKYRGGAGLPPSTFKILVSTPQAFRTAQQNGIGHLQWSAFRVVIFDEVHHVLKDHPYRKLALSLRRSSLTPPPAAAAAAGPSSHPRVVGLTASYSYAVGDAKTKASLTRMCHELRITTTETATRQELEASGYHATGAAAEVLLGPRPDSAGTTDDAAPAGVVPEADRKPHEMGTTFFRREAKGTSTAFTRLLMACVRGMEEATAAAAAAAAEAAQAAAPSSQPRQTLLFASPMPPSGDLAPREWGAYTHKLALKAAGGGGGGGGGAKILETAAGRGIRGGGGFPGKSVTKRCTRCGIDANAGQPRRSSARPTLHLLLAELEHWYEAVKVLVVSWEEREDDAATILDMFGCTGSPSDRAASEAVWPGDVRQKISAFWEAVPGTFPRYEKLKNVLLDKYDHHGGDGSSSGGGGGGGKKGFRGIVFVVQRVTTHVLAHAIAADPRMAPRFSAACLYASSSPATASLSVTKAQAQASIEAFRSGSVNLLLATVVAEEGMDVPKANCVVRYDAMVHAVSMVQGRGRAREEDSSFVVLSERPDRTTADLEAVERQQQRLVRGFRPPAAGSAAAAAGDAALVVAQRARERGACEALLGAAAAQGGGGGGALSAINFFAQKTKAALEDGWSKGAGGQWVCTLSYESPLRELHATGTAPGKKAAKKLAAAKLLAGLREAVAA